MSDLEFLNIQAKVREKPMRQERIDKLIKEIFDSDVVASETLRSCLQDDEYKDTTDEELEYLLNITGDNEFVVLNDIR